MAIKKMTMPKLSDTMEEGTITRWLKKEGDAVEAGQVIAEAESDKATMELESFDKGILRKIVIPEGDKVKIGGLIAIIGDKDEDISELLKSEQEKSTADQNAERKRETKSKSPWKATPPPPPPRVSPPAKPKVKTASNGTRLKASPLAKKMALDKGINLRNIQGSGAGGRIIRHDVLNYLQEESQMQEEKAPLSKAVKTDLSSMREAIVRRMTLSKTTIPHFYLTMNIDMEKAAGFRKAVNESQSEVKISFNDIIVKAVSLALVKHKTINASFADNHIIQHNRIDIGIAVALDDGLITPVIRNCNRKSIGEISREIQSLAKRAKKRKLVPEEYSNATFTISNLGMYDIEEFSAIINPPEAAILAVGSIKNIPVVEDDEIKVGQRMKMTLSSDHRVIDGATAALFMRDLKKRIENPTSMVP